MKNIKPIARKTDIVVQTLPDETLIYDLNNNKAFCLNETSALVWELCDGTRSAVSISNEISLRLKTLVNEEFVLLAFRQLINNRLLEDSTMIDANRSGPSRRELVRKAGFASLVALPIISSLAAPEAAGAQSCSVFLSTCGANADCCSNNCVSGSNPDTCCAPGAMGNRSPGNLFSCQGGQLGCDASSNLNCCSGTSTINMTNVGCEAFPGTFGCVCD